VRDLLSVGRSALMSTDELGERKRKGYTVLLSS
jgi:hypothetical protein